MNITLKFHPKTENRAIMTMLDSLASQFEGLSITDEKDADLILLGPDTPDEPADVPFLKIALPVTPSQLLMEMNQAASIPKSKDMWSHPVNGENFELQPDHLELKNKSTDERVRLTEKEYHLLYTLAAAPENWMAREDLLKEIWGYEENIETHTLETHIYRLRRKIEETPSAPKIFVNENQGYKLYL